MTAHFHGLGEIRSEIEAAGVRHEATLAVEGAAWLSPTLSDDLDDPFRRERLLEILRATEAERRCRLRACIT